MSEFIQSFFTAESGIITGLFSIFIALIRNAQMKKREINALLFRDKAEIYEKFMDIIKNLILSTKGFGKHSKKIDPNFLAKEMADIKAKAIIFGGRELIEAFNKFQKAANDKDPLARIREAEELLRAFRSDLGHRDALLKKGELIKIFTVSEDDDAIDEIFKNKN